MLGNRLTGDSRRSAAARRSAGPLPSRRAASRLSLEQLEDRCLLSVTVNPTFKTLDFRVDGTFSGTTVLRHPSYSGGVYRDTFSGYTNQTGQITYANESNGAGTVSGSGGGTGVDDCSSYAFAFTTVGSLTDAGGVLARTSAGGSFHYTSIPDHCRGSNSNPSAIPTVGNFSTSTFTATVRWRKAIQYGYTKGTWTDVVTFQSPDPYDIDVASAEWIDEDSLTFSFSVSGPPQHAPSHTTPVGKVRMYWSYGDEPTSIRTPSGINDVPIYWNSGGATVTVDDLPKTANGASHLVIVADPDWLLAEADETNNFQALQLVEFKEVAAQYDDQVASNVFGTYLPGVPLDNLFAVEMIIRGYDYSDPFIGFHVEYAFGGGGRNGYATQTAQGNTYIFIHDMGSLVPNNQTLVLKADYFGQHLARYDATVLVARDLNVTFEVDYGDGPVDLEDLRLLTEVHNEGSWQVTARVPDLPLPAAYANLDVQLQMQRRDAGNRRTAVAMQRVGFGVYRTNLDFGQFRDLVDGSDYGFSLKADTLRRYAVPFTRQRNLLVITLPPWLLASSTPTYDAAKLAYDLKIDYQTKYDPVSAIDPYGLLNGKATWGSLHVVAPIFAKPDVNEDVIAELEKFEVVGAFLGRPIGPYSVPLANLEVQLSLDRRTLDVGNMLSVQMRSPVSISGQAPFDASGASQIKIPKFPLPKVGVVDTQFDVSLSATGTIGVRAGIALQKSGKTLTVIPILPSSPGVQGDRGSFVEISAAGGAFAEINAGISAIQVGPCNLVNISGIAQLAVSVHGVLWTGFSGSIGYVNGALVGGISAGVDQSRSGAAIGVAYRLEGSIGAFCNLLKGNIVNVGPDLVTHQLFGGKNLESRIENAFRKGQGIFAKVNPPPGPSPTPATAFSSPSASPSASPAGPQGSLEIAAPIAGTLRSLTFDLEAFADRPALTAGRHRVDTILRSDAGELVVDSFDLAALALAPAESPLGYASDTVRREIALPTGALDPARWYTLEFAFYSDGGAGGETVQVALDDLALEYHAAQAAFSAEHSDLADGRLDFGPDTSGAAETVVTIVNAGAASLPVERIEIVGSDFSLLDAPSDAFVLAPGHEVSIRVRLDSLDDPATGILRVVTSPDDPDAAYELPLAYDGLATIDTVAPEVVAWSVRSSDWSAAIPDLSPTGASLAHANLDQIVATFSEPVSASAANLAVWGGLGLYGIAAYEFDAATNRGIWTLDRPLDAENLTAELGAGIVDSAGLPLAPPPLLSLTAVPGDIDGDGLVGLGDLVRIAARLGATTVLPDTLAEDLDRDGVVNRADAAHLASRFGANSSLFPQPNQRPILAPIAAQGVDEHETLVVVISAVDPDASGTLTFSLADAPTGAEIDAATGEFRWTPNANDGPGAYAATVRVVDQGNPPLAAETTFTIQVYEPDLAPQLDPIDDRSILQGETLFVHVEAHDPNGLADPFAFALDDAPASMAIDPQSGALFWTPSYAVAPGAYSVTVRVHSVAAPQLFSTVSFTVDVAETNVAPEFADLPEMQIAEGQPIQFQAFASDVNFSQTVSYALADDAPVGAAIDPATGAFTWQPTSADPTGVYKFTIVATDDGAVPLSTAVQVTVYIVESNSPAEIEPIADVVAAAGDEVVVPVVALDFDLPLYDLVYTLEPGAPEGASIDAVTGEFAWTPPLSATGDYVVSVRVEDDSPTPVAAFIAFTIHVVAETTPPELSAALANDTGAAGDAVTFDPTIRGVVNDVSGVATLLASVSGVAPENFVDISAALAGDGTFIVDATTLAVVTGGPLADGPYLVYLVAIDGAGNASAPVAVAFELAATAPAILSFEIAPEHDTAPAGDGETDLPTADLVGVSDPGMRVVLVGEGVETFADAAGEFRLSGVALAAGYQTLTVRAENAGGLAIETPLTVYRTPDDCTPPDPANSVACVVLPAFEDVRVADQELPTYDDDYTALGPAELGDFRFTFYGVEYDTLYVGSNGQITFGDGDASPWPSDLTAEPYMPTIAALWDDWRYYDEVDASGIFWQVVGDAPSRRLVVQWQDVLPYSDDFEQSLDTVTFQAVLYESSNRIQFNYLDLASDEPSTEGASATVGAKGEGYQDPPVQWLPVSIAAGPNAFVGTGKSVLITPGDAAPPPPDFDPPYIELSLPNDVVYPGDFLTNDAALGGTVYDASAIARLELWYDGTFSGEYPDTAVDILSLLDADGSFEIPQAVLEGFLGTAFVEGSYWFLVDAEDVWGNAMPSPAEIYFWYDATPPAIAPDFDLAPISEGAIVGDLTTPYSRATLVGYAEPYSEVYVVGQESRTLTQADDFGQFLLRGVTLAEGVNAITVVSRDFAGNQIAAANAITYALTNCVGPDAFGYEACLVAPAFVDISATGNAVPFDQIVSFLPLTPADLDGFTFEFYGAAQTNFFVSPVGAIVPSEFEPWDNTPGDLQNYPLEPVIAAFWDAAYDYDAFVGSQVYWQVEGAAGDRRLIVQWDSLAHWGTTEQITFQAILYEADGAIELNYRDMETEFEDPYLFYSAVAGIKDAGPQTLEGNVLYLAAYGPTQFTSTGASVRIAMPSAPLAATLDAPLAAAAADALLAQAAANPAGAPHRLNRDGGELRAEVRSTARRATGNDSNRQVLRAQRLEPRDEVFGQSRGDWSSVRAKRSISRSALCTAADAVGIDAVFGTNGGGA